VAWGALRHPNVLPLLGVTMSENRFVIVLEWMANGDINEFVKVHPDVDRLELVCFFAQWPHLRSPSMMTRLLQLRDVIRGLIYVHDQGIVHGDLKGARL